MLQQLFMYWPYFLIDTHWVSITLKFLQAVFLECLYCNWLPHFSPTLISHWLSLDLYSITNGLPQTISLKLAYLSLTCWCLEAVLSELILIDTQSLTDFQRLYSLTENGLFFSLQLLAGLLLCGVCFFGLSLVVYINITSTSIAINTS